VRCPVSASDVSHKTTENSASPEWDQRIRERLPVMPALGNWVDVERTNSATVLHAVNAAAHGALSTAPG